MYCRVCYLRAYGPGGKNKFGEANPVAMDDESAPEACVRCHSKVNFSAKSISVSRNFREINFTNFFDTNRFLK